MPCTLERIACKLNGTTSELLVVLRDHGFVLEAPDEAEVHRTELLPWVEQCPQCRHWMPTVQRQNEEGEALPCPRCGEW